MLANRSGDQQSKGGIGGCCRGQKDAALNLMQIDLLVVVECLGVCAKLSGQTRSLFILSDNSLLGCYLSSESFSPHTQNNFTDPQTFSRLQPRHSHQVQAGVRCENTTSVSYESSRLCQYPLSI